ncbi:putative ABC-type xenobiotic transporter [Microsporum ferrugineum]
MALILISAIVAEVGSMSICSSFMVKYTKMSLSAYADGSTAAEEAISSIRHVTAFGIQDKLADRYQKFLTKAEGSGLRSRLALAAMMAIMNCVIFWTYGLTFWQGSRYLVVREIELGAIITILLATLTGAFTFGNIAPNFQAFATGMAATEKILATVARKSPLDPSISAGDRLQAVSGTIELKNIRHVYPSRPDVLTLDGINLLFPGGKMTAIVGASGCGKSTIAGLIERFYEPISGEILLDGHDITSLNLQWLRQQVAIVTQEPTLFSTTVFENIRFGLIGTEHENSSLRVVEELVFDAAKKANCFEFISALPDGFHTTVGARGSLLSGGQKQRVAIARAIISNPKVLLLDEATSALDAQAERLVQAALDVAAEGRTTITISHRLSTITAAANIIVMSHGRVIEQGTHNELLEKRSTYYQLVEKQRLSSERNIVISEAKSALDRGADLPNVRDDYKESDEYTHEIRPYHEAEASVRASKRKAGNSLWELIKFVANFNKEETLIMVLGLFWSIITGAGNPTQAVFYGKTISAMSLPPSMYGELRREVNFWSLMYLAAYEASATYACEASAAIKTVASLSLESHVKEHYHNILEAQRQKSVVSTLKSSTLYAASQSAHFFCISLAFWYGGTLIVHDGYSVLQFFICYAAIIAGAFSAGAIFSFAPDMSKSRQAAQDIKTLLDRPVNIDVRQGTGEILTKIDGSLEMRNIYFRYPNRPEKMVIAGLSLSVQPGQYIGLVGASGCGKSTIIALLERFFDPEAGQILVDGKDISKLNIKNYRSHLALVSQELTLYQGTIRENITLGTNDEDVSEEKITKAYKDANIYDFIRSLPDGFSTVIGARGGMLSGGQQQRIAIARALLRDPRILLLDEATSALDSESEKIVQDALNAAAQGRTTVAVAHRISTVQNADCIYGKKQTPILSCNDKD